MTAKNVVPFGKYKGQPVEVLAQDRPYLEWLSAQDWFRERYAGIYTLIVNNFSEPTETPDHNALQVLFLDDAFCEKFVTVIWPEWKVECQKELLATISERKRKFAETLARQKNDVESTRRWFFANYLPTLESPRKEREIESHRKEEAARFKRNGEIESAVASFPGDVGLRPCFRRTFEERGIDVILSCSMQTTVKLPDLAHDQVDSHISSFGYGEFSIEIKPTVGDDYPAILRQMRANKSTVLFVDAYTGKGATREQFVKTFASAERKVVFRNALGE
jgi:hypothetical protein